MNRTKLIFSILFDLIFFVPRSGRGYLLKAQSTITKKKFSN